MSNVKVGSINWDLPNWGCRGCKFLIDSECQNQPSDDELIINGDGVYCGLYRKSQTTVRDDNKEV